MSLPSRLAAGLLALGVTLALLAPASAAPASDAVRVGLFRLAPPPTLRVAAPAPWRIESGGRGLGLKPGSAVQLRAQGDAVAASLGRRVLLVASELRLTGPAPWRLAPQSSPERPYMGRLTVRARDGRLQIVLTLGLEDYVRACVGAEMPPDWPAAALGAQVVVSRSYALAGRGRHERDGFDFCDLTHCQRFRGLAGQDPRIDSALSHTAGRVLLWRGHPAEALWHAACGGWRAANHMVFGGAPVPYMQGGPDASPSGKAWCRDWSHGGAWSFDAEPARLEAALKAAGRLGPWEQLAGLTVSDRALTGTATTVRLTGDHARSLSGYALWMALGPHFGWGEFASPAFTITRQGNQYRFNGHGLGHGVGLCQWGARGQALAGRSPETILKFYFPGTAIGRI